MPTKNSNNPVSGYNVNSLALYFRNSDNGSGFFNREGRRDLKLNGSEFAEALAALVSQLQNVGIETGVSDLGRFQDNVKKLMGDNQIDVIALEKSLQNSQEAQDGVLTFEEIGFTPEKFSSIEAGTFSGQIFPHATDYAQSPIRPSANGYPRQKIESEMPWDGPKPEFSINLADFADLADRADVGRDGILTKNEVAAIFRESAEVRGSTPDEVRELEASIRAVYPEAITKEAFLSGISSLDKNHDGNVKTEELGINPKELAQIQNSTAIGITN